MKRQRSYGDGLDDDRSRFYDRGPPPPPRRPPPREYEGDRFDRRKGFGGGGSYDNRYREYPSPREYGGDRALHRSESFSGFRREFPKGFRSERDRPRRDGDGSSAWRRPGAGWREAEGHGEHRSAARLSAASLPVTPRRSRSRSPIQSRRRFEVAKLEKLRKQSASINEMEEGEVAPDEHRKQVEPSRAKEKGRERGEVKKVDPGVSVDSENHCKRVTDASHFGNAGDGLVAAEATDKGREQSALEVEAEGEASHDAGKFGLCTSPVHQQGLQERANSHEEATDSANAVEQSASTTILKEYTQEETTAQAETTHDIDVIGMGDSSSSRAHAETTHDIDVIGMSASSSRQGATQEEATLFHRTGCAADEVQKNTSSIVLREVRQDHSVVLNGTTIAVDDDVVGKSASSNMVEEITEEDAMQHDGTANAADRVVDEVGKGVSSVMVEEVLQQEVMKRDGTANAADRVEIGTSGILQEVMQEKVPPIADEVTNTVDHLEPVCYSGLMKEAMHGEDLAVDEMASTTGVVGQFNSSDMTEDAVHKKLQGLGVTEAVVVAEESNISTGPTREVVACLHQQALENTELEHFPVVEEKISEPTEFVASQPAEEEHCKRRGAPVETTLAEGVAITHENIKKRVKLVKTESANLFFQPTKEHTDGRKGEAANANVVTGEPMDEDKGNAVGIAFDVLSKKDNIDLAETVGSGVDSTLQLRTEPTKTLKSASTTSLKQEHEAIKIEKLDLSLSLSGCLQNSESKSSTSKTGSLVHAPRSQLLPSSSFRTNSDQFTASMSLTNSQTLGQNHSCSLRQPLDNYDHSVGSKTLFAGVDQLSSESTKKGGATAQLHRARQNSHVPDNTLVGISDHSSGMPKDHQSVASIPGVLSPTHSHGSQDPGLEHSRFRRQLTGERSSSSLSRGERQEGEQVIINGSGVVERVISKIVSEPFHHTARMLQEMTENSIRYLREAISETIVNPDKRGQIIALQEALKKRSDLNSDMLRTCPQLLMEILVAIRTGLPYFIKKSSGVASSDLVDIFLNLKCRNLSCRSVLPVDDCDCKICQRKSGFCSSCMCIVCSKFDSASNTCSWVGCDVCLHWCHTDCGLRHSLIRKGQNSSRTYNTNEMQFHCAACGHPSEMFGFVKEVFRTCARQWRMDTLARELRYVERIFSCSDDTRGKRVWDFVRQMLIKLENKAYYPEVVKCVITFFSDDDANLGTGPSEPLRGIPCNIAEGVDGIPSSSRTAAWKPYTLEGLPVLNKEIFRSTTESPSLHRKSGEAELHADDNKPFIDELDSLVRLKQAEANMYQERANDARSQVDDLRHIVMVKTARIEEDYATRIAELNINEIQERRKQKIEELQAFERAHLQFFSMKTRMEGSIRELLLKMEATQQN